MPKIETALGDAIFSVDFDFERTGLLHQWSDTTHFHVDSEVHIIFNGDALIEIDGKDVQIKAGDVCLLAPRSSHYPKFYGNTLERTNFSFSLTKNHNHARIDKTFSEYVYYSNIFKSVNKFFIINDTELLSIVKKLIGEHFSIENEHVTRALLGLFFINLAKRIKEHNLPYEEHSFRSISESENFFKQRKIVEEFFQTRYNEDIKIEDLAKMLCLSIPHTHRVVKKVFDGGFKKNLMRQRIEHACMLIKQGDLPLTEIAYRCGYTSYNGFLSAFKSYTGKTPKEYEKSIR